MSLTALVPRLSTRKLDTMDTPSRNICLVNGSAIEGHLSLLGSLARDCEIVVEFGVQVGESTKTFAQNVQARLVSYDIVTCDVVHVADIAEGRNIDFEFRCQDSLLADIPECDMLFIDSLHTYRQLRGELFQHSGKVQKYIGMHDTWTFGLQGEDRSVPGLEQAIEEFLVDNDSWKVLCTTTENNGLTILVRRQSDYSVVGC